MTAVHAERFSSDYAGHESGAQTAEEYGVSGLHNGGNH